MNKELEDLQYLVKRRFSFGINPQFSENFKTNIKDTQIIPLIQEVFKILDWPIVYTDNKSVEAKRKNQWNKLTAKITVTKKSSGRIEVHSKSLEGHLTDFGKNSKRTGLFIALFKKLEKEYSANGKLNELEEEFNKINNWEEYEVPDKLPLPKKNREPNISIAIVGGLILAIILGFFYGYLTNLFGYLIGLYEFGIGISVGYLFGKILVRANYLHEKPAKIMIGSILLIILISSQFIGFIIIKTQNSLTDLSFFNFINLHLERGLTIDNIETGWIGLIIVWGFQLVLPFIIAVFKSTLIVMKAVYEKVPEEVLEYTIFLIKKNKPISEVRLLLAEKGWSEKSDQEDIFDAINVIIGIQDFRRE